MRELTIALGDYPHTAPLRDGRVTSDLISLKFIDYDPVSDAFDHMVRQQRFDISELAVGAFLQARAARKPITLLPVVVVGGFHHGRLFYLPEHGRVTPADLPGSKVAIRSYSQTTGLWLRGILHDQYGVDSDAITWVTLEDSHAAEYHDPPNTERAPDGAKLIQLLKDGAVSAAALGKNGAPGTATVISDVKAAQAEFYDRFETTGINHMVTVRDDIANDEQLTREIYRMFTQAHTLVLGENGTRTTADGRPSPIREGVPATATALDLAIGYARQQHIISDAPATDSLFPSYLVEG
jgi:4,5-dihydroxyphthalate decarboxylase